jgi:hypothetical protein
MPPLCGLLDDFGRGVHRPLTTNRILLGALLLQISVVAQPTNNVLQRVLMVESQFGRGSVFSLDVDQREYWINAKHILNGAQHPPYGSVESKSVQLRILNPGVQGEQWLTINFSVLDPGEDIDIVVLAPPKTLLTDPLPSDLVVLRVGSGW